ncbi:MAG TPA: hypothetical protein VKV21_14585 [Solirubrobacteraceae bacterium]|nr:hypothetical protein [Solirubrobacteraceae bacterium]
MSALPSLTGGLPAIDYANEPYEIRHGDRAAKAAYAEGLGFEQVFLNQLTQQLTATLSGSSSDSSDSSADSSDGSSASTGGPYSSLLSSALTQGVMSSGGAGGLAMQLAESIDPSLGLHSSK